MRSGSSALRPRSCARWRCALRARAARRLARLLRVHRLHRARRDGDRRRRLGRREPRRRARARRPRHPRRRSVVLADPARGRARRTRFLASARRASRVAATMRAMARTPTDGRTALVELKAVDAAYPLYGAVALDPPQPLAAVLAQRDGAFGAAADPALLARLDLKPGARITRRRGHHRDPRGARLRARQARRRHRLRPAPAHQRRRACAQPACCSPAAWCAGTTGCACPTTTPTDAAVRAVTAAAQAQLPEAGWDIRTPHQCLARARAERRALHAIPHAGRTDRAAGRRRRRGQRGQGPSRPPPRRDRDPEIARRHRRPRVRDLSDAGRWCWPRSARCPDWRSARRCRS